MNSNKEFIENISLSCFSNLKIHNTVCQYTECNPPNKIIQIICKKSFSLVASSFKTELDLICKDEHNNIYIALIFHQKITKELIIKKIKVLIVDIKTYGNGIQFYIIPIEISGRIFKPNITVESKMEYREKDFSPGKFFYSVSNNIININNLNKNNFIKFPR